MKKKVIVVMICAVIVLLFFYIPAKMRQKQGGNIAEQLKVKKEHFGVRSFSHKSVYKDEKKKTELQEPKAESTPAQDLVTIFTNLPIEVKLRDIADSNPSGTGFILKEVDLYGKQGEITGTDFLSALKILNKKRMPSDYFQSEEYKTAYEEIDRYYPDIFIWPYFTNEEAKSNFFKFLLSRYAANNKRWRSYEKDIADCSQFSQRIYFFLYPDKIAMEDENYFYFLFSDERNREERKKRCNKIPDIFYTVLNPFVLKKETDEPPLTGHAMISFAPDNHLEKIILAESQNGVYKSIKEDFRSILQEHLGQYPLILRLGKILSISGDNRHEAKIKEEGIYFSPPELDESSRYGPEDPRYDYDGRPILINKQTYQLCQVLSAYLEQVLAYQSPDRNILLSSLEDIVKAEKNIIQLSVDIIMNHLITFENRDLHLVRDEINELTFFIEEQPGLSPTIRKLAEELTYVFQLKLKPFLE